MSTFEGHGKILSVEWHGMVIKEVEWPGIKLTSNRWVHSVLFSEGYQNILPRAVQLVVDNSYKEIVTIILFDE